MKYGSLLLLFCVALVGSSEDIFEGRSYFRKRRNLVFPGGGQILVKNILIWKSVAAIVEELELIILNLLVKKFWLEILRTEPRFVEVSACNLVTVRYARSLYLC
jgi:hypothetical protein